MKLKYYSLDRILSYNAVYNVIYGERSNGKTFSVLRYALEQWLLHGKQTALIRRWAEDFRGKRGQTMFTGLVEKGIVKKLSKGAWHDVKYYAGRWYLTKTVDEDGKLTTVTQDEPFCYGFALTEQEHDKSTSYPKISTIIFDEFLSRTGYLPDEFVLFQNVLSTIIRNRSDVIIFMVGNTINKYCPYFNEMGLRHVKQQKQGTIDFYKYGDTGLTVAVEYCEAMPSKPSQKYFAFDNPKLNMITSGEWEISVYPHLPRKYIQAEVIQVFYIEFDGELLQGNVIQQDDVQFIYIHRKTTPIKSPETAIIYSPVFSERPNYCRRITAPSTPLQKAIAELFRRDKVFYQDNDVGDLVHNYVRWCVNSNG